MFRMGASREDIAAEAMKTHDAYERAKQQITELQALAEVQMPIALNFILIADYLVDFQDNFAEST
jgi:hypothetical protein